MKTRLLFVALLTTISTARVFAGECTGLPSATQLQQYLSIAPSTGGDAGGSFHGTLMWAAVVNRDGAICAYVTSTSDPSEVWPGSQAIAKSKAYTANAFSNDSLPLSTARLYTFTQPGHSLWSLANANPFAPFFLAPPGGQGGGRGLIAGGMIFFGGGLPLYSGGRIIGGLGISGDTSCTDHEIAKAHTDSCRYRAPRAVRTLTTSSTPSTVRPGSCTRAA